MILLPENDLESACSVAEKLRVKIEAHDFNLSRNVTCSFGVTEIKVNESHEELIKRVDANMYTAKNNGRNRVECK